MEDFDQWNELKKKVNIKDTHSEFFPQVGEVWICILGKNIGREQNGGSDNFSRPTLIVKKFNNEIFWILPLSTKQKNLDFYYNFIDLNNGKASVILSQIRLVHIKRFERKVYEMPLKDMNDIKGRLRDYLV